MKFLLLALVSLVLAAPAVAAPRPEAHPSCHCKARWDHGAYVYREVWRAEDGTLIYAKCRVNPRNGNTWCWIVRIG
jgi:hypothetical protein